MEMHRFVASAIHLPPACDARKNLKTLTLPRFVHFNQVRDFRTRSDKAHRTSKHVEKLGEFIQTETTQETSNARDPRIIFRFMNQVPIYIAFFHPASQLLRIF